MNGHVSTLDLHRYRYGELDPAAVATVRDHVSACDVCRQRLRVQEATRAEFVARPVPAAIRAAARPARRRAWWGLLVLLPVAAVGLAVLVAGPAATVAIVAPVVEDTRPKGEPPALEVWIETDGGARVLSAGDRVRVGDRLQLQFAPRGARWVALVGRDGTGDIEIYGIVEAKGDALQAAPFSLVLDDAPGPQEFLAIGSDTRPTEHRLREIVRSNSARADTSSVRFEKE